MKNVDTRLQKDDEKIKGLGCDINDLITENAKIVEKLENDLATIDAIKDFIKECESELANAIENPLDSEALEELKKKLNDMKNEIGNNKDQLSDISPQFKQNVDELESKLNSLLPKAVEKLDKTTALLGKIGDLQNSTSNLDDRLAELNSLFDNASCGIDLDDIQAKKRAIRAELDAIAAETQGIRNDDKNAGKSELEEKLNDALAKFHDLDEKIAAQMLIDAENEIRKHADDVHQLEESITNTPTAAADPEVIKGLLSDVQEKLEDLERRRTNLRNLDDQCSRALRIAPAGNEAAALKSDLDAAKQKLAKLSDVCEGHEKTLESLLPLATHYDKTLEELQGWLDEIEIEVETHSREDVGNDLELIRSQKETAENIQQQIEDHQPKISDLSLTGSEISQLVPDDEASSIKDDVENITARYEEVKAIITQRVNELEASLRELHTKPSEKLDDALETLANLRNRVDCLDPVGANPDDLQGQLQEIKNLQDKLAVMGPILDEIASDCETSSNHDNDDDDDDGRLSSSDESEKRLEAIGLYDDVTKSSEAREKAIASAMPLAEHFWSMCNNLNDALQDLLDNVSMIDSASIDPHYIEEQSKEVDELEKEYNLANEKVKECKTAGGNLSDVSGAPGKMEIKKHLNDLDLVCGDIEDELKDKRDELNVALEKAKKLQSLIEKIMKWLPLSEQRFDNLSPIASESRKILIQIEELKVLNVQVTGHGKDLDQLAGISSDITDTHPNTATKLAPIIGEFNARWEDLMAKIADRENDLTNSLIKVSELDTALDEVIGLMQATEEQLSEMDRIFANPRYADEYLRNVKAVKSEIGAQKEPVTTLSKLVDEIVGPNEDMPSSLSKKKKEMNDLFESIMRSLKARENKLKDGFKEIKHFASDIESALQMIDEFRVEIRDKKPMGAIPYTARKNQDRFSGKMKEFLDKEPYIQSLVLNGSDIINRCTENEAPYLEERLQRMQNRWNSTKRRGDKKMKKLEGHCAYVQGFHESLQNYADWLLDAEERVYQFRYPSKIVERCQNQTKDHHDFMLEVVQHREILQDLDMTGTYLKYFGTKEDTIYVKTQISNIKLRFKKLTRRAEERGRLLHRALKEDQRFENGWQNLLDWLADNIARAALLGSSNDEDDLLKDCEELKRITNAIHGKYPSFHSVLRMGKSLQDRCTKSDPDQESLQNMLDRLKNDWAKLRNTMLESKKHVDDSLMALGQSSNAVQSLMDYLAKAETDLKKQSSVCGDVDTVDMLIERHKQFQVDLKEHGARIESMKDTAESHVDPEIVKDLADKYQSVLHLSDNKEKTLIDSRHLAGTFQAAVEKMTDWLPHAESELGFRPLPITTEDIRKANDRHNKFLEEIAEMEQYMNTISELGGEILTNCHPTAKKYVQQCTSGTKQRWEQIKNRAENRASRLRAALKAGEATAGALDDLQKFLEDAHHRLVAPEHHSVKTDLQKTKEALEEHLAFHDVLTEKGNEIKSHSAMPVKKTGAHVRPGSAKGIPQRIGSSLGNRKRSDSSTAYNNKISGLNRKYRSVYRQSLDRKKILQDRLKKLQELEGMKKFDFERWRMRYLGFVNAKKYRLTDLFRRSAKKGVISKSEFIEGIMSSKFPTNRTELSAVFHCFDKNGSGEIDYEEFMTALKPDKYPTKQVAGASATHDRLQKKKPATESELIHDQIQKEASKCSCCNQFRVEKVGDGKYRMGDNKKLVLVRFLNSCVMVRVGGGWERLETFLETHDPCRSKGRTNTELRENFIGNFNQSRATFTSRRATRSSVSKSRDHSPSGRTRSTASSMGSRSGSKSNLSTRSSLAGSRTSLSSSRSSLLDQ